MSEGTLVVKMVPYNPQKGFKLKRYHAKGRLFENDGKWYKVDAELADFLRTVHSVPRLPSSPLAFLVMTEAEAVEWERQWRKGARKLGAVDGAAMFPDEVGNAASQEELDALRRENSDLRKSQARLVNRLDALEAMVEKNAAAAVTSATEPEEDLAKAEPDRGEVVDLGIDDEPPEEEILPPPLPPQPKPEPQPVAAVPAPAAAAEEPPRAKGEPRTTWSSRSSGKRGKK